MSRSYCVHLFLPLPRKLLHKNLIRSINTRCSTSIIITTFFFCIQMTDRLEMSGSPLEGRYPDSFDGVQQISEHDLMTANTTTYVCKLFSVSVTPHSFVTTFMVPSGWIRISHIINTNDISFRLSCLSLLLISSMFLGKQTQGSLT